MTVESDTVSALKWVGAARLTVQFGSWVITLIVIRLLAPDDYGLMASIAVVTGVVAAIAELGLGAAVVQARSITRDELAQLNGICWILGLGGAAIVVGLAPVIAWAFRDERLVLIASAVSLNFLISGLAVVPDALLARAMAFSRLAKIEVGIGLIAALTTLALAAEKFGVWALVIGQLAGSVARATALLMASPAPWPQFRLGGISRFFSFGSSLLVNRIVFQIMSQADVAIASRLLSKSDVGHYAVALQLATLPMQKLMSIINQITLPAVSRLQDEMARARSRILQSIAIMTLVSVPLMWGISAIAPELVAVLLGRGWSSAEFPIRMISLVVPARMLSSLLNTTVLGIGEHRADLFNSLVHAAVLPACFLIGVQWGTNGLATSWLGGFALVLSLTLPRTARTLGLRLASLGRETIGPVCAGALMYIAVSFARGPMDGLSDAARLTLLIGIGALVYCATAALLARRNVRLFVDLLRVARGTTRNQRDTSAR